MSSYMQALKRTQQVVTPLVEPRRLAREVEAAAASASVPEIGALLDTLRALAAQGTPARVVVFAPVAAGAAARELVAESGATRRADLRTAAARVHAAGCRALGVVLTRRHLM